MEEFVATAEKAVLSIKDATARQKSPGKLWDQLNSTKEKLTGLVTFFGALLSMCCYHSLRVRVLLSHCGTTPFASGEDPAKVKAQDVLKIISMTCDDYTKA